MIKIHLFSTTNILTMEDCGVEDGIFIFEVSLVNLGNKYAVYLFIFM